MPTRNDEAFGTFILAGLLALGREAPRRAPMLAAFGASAVRVVDRIHCDAAVVRHTALPPLATRLANRGVHVVRIGHCADCCHAAAMHQALLRGAQAQDDVVLIATDNLHVAAGRARKLPAFADLEFNIVHDRTDRDIGDRHRITRLHVGVLRRDHAVAGGKPLRRQDISEFAVLVFDQRDEGRAVRIIFEPLDGRWHIEFLATEIDPPIGLLVTATTETRRDAPIVVAPTRRMLPFGKRLDRRPLVQGRAIDNHQLALGRRHRIVSF